MRRRATSLSPHDMLLLRSWGDAVFHSFSSPAFLVGSVARVEDWRDVDIRVVLPDDHPLCQLFGLPALNAAMSFWGQRATGLPIDFQFQPQTEANTHDGPRHALFTIRAPKSLPGEEKE